jgi:hypothetical protein
MIVARKRGGDLRENLVRLGWRTFAIRLKDSKAARVGERVSRIVDKGTAGF